MANNMKRYTENEFYEAIKNFAYWEGEVNHETGEDEVWFYFHLDDDGNLVSGVDEAEYTDCVKVLEGDEAVAYFDEPTDDDEELIKSRLYPLYLEDIEKWDVGYLF